MVDLVWKNLPLDMNGEGQRSLTRRLKPVEIFLALQLEPDSPDFYAKLKGLPTNLDEKISILFDGGTPSGAVGHVSRKIGALDHYPDDAPILIDRIQ